MPEKIVEYEIKVCQECECAMTPNFYPGNEYTEPQDGISYLALVVPAWTCPACGFHTLVKKEEVQTWLFANLTWQRSLVMGMNMITELAEQHGLHECDGCGNCESECGNPTPGETLAAIFDEEPEQPEEEESEEFPTKRGRPIH